MKPFDLEKSKAGEPVITRDGRNVRIICFDMKQNPFLIVALIDYGDYEELQIYTNDGKFHYNNIDSDLDLFMKPKVVVYHYCIHRDRELGIIQISCMHESLEELMYKYEACSDVEVLEYRTISVKK